MSISPRVKGLAELLRNTFLSSSLAPSSLPCSLPFFLCFYVSDDDVRLTEERKTRKITSVTKLFSHCCVPSARNVDGRGVAGTPEPAGGGHGLKQQQPERLNAENDLL